MIRLGGALRVHHATQKPKIPDIREKMRGVQAAI
jgi:hypothetical protein